MSVSSIWCYWSGAGSDSLCDDEPWDNIWSEVIRNWSLRVGWEVCYDEEPCTGVARPTLLGVEDFGSLSVLRFFFEQNRGVDFEWERFGSICDVLNAWKSVVITLVNARLWIGDEKRIGRFGSSTNVLCFRLSVVLLHICCQFVARCILAEDFGGWNLLCNGCVLINSS